MLCGETENINFKVHGKFNNLFYLHIPCKNFSRTMCQLQSSLVHVPNVGTIFNPSFLQGILESIEKTANPRLTHALVSLASCTLWTS